MFYRIDLLKLSRFNIMNLNRPMYNRFIYLDDADDVASIYGVPYEVGLFNNATGRTIKILSGPSNVFQPRLILQLVQLIISFKFKFISANHDRPMDVLMGLYDMNLARYSNLLSSESLLPTTSRSHRLWVVNLEMIGTPTFFVDMFDSYLWLAFIVAFILIGLLSSLGIYMLQRYTQVRFDYMTWFSQITNQGGDENSKLISPKVLLIVLSVLAIMFHGSFEAHLSSYLAIRIPDLPFTTLDELMKITDYSICVPVFSQSHGYIADRLKLNMKQHHHLNDRRCPDNFKQLKMMPGLLRLKDFCPMDKTVFFVANLDVIENVTCPNFNIIPLHEQYFRLYDTFLVSPGFKYREQFNRGLIRVRSSGFLTRILTKHKKKIGLNYRQFASTVNNRLQIQFHQTKIILLIPFVSVVLGTIILVLELLIKIHYK